MMSGKIEIQKENQNLIALAVKCKFITADQEQEVLSYLIENSQQDPGMSVVDIFLEKGILSRGKIQFLFELKSHLKRKMLDKRFGELGVTNRFVSSKHVEDALEIQNTYFKQNKKSKKIGDILIEQNKITPANKTAILLTQNRIQDHLLEQAMQEIATSEIEKMTINMRFGAIAVKKGLISLDQLNQALKFQKKESESGQNKRYLGEILQDFFSLSKEDVLYILKIQKEIEKKRLSLEKALINYNSEIDTNKRLNELFTLSISKDKMEACIHRVKDSFEKIDLNHFYNWLKLNSIKFGLQNKKAIEVFLNDSDVGSSLQIAKGIHPCPGEDEKIEFFFDLDSPPGEELPQELSHPVVKKGDILAAVTPPKPGKTGTNVQGHLIKPADPKIYPLMCGNGVLKKDLVFLADTDGKPVLYKHRSLFVEPVNQNHPCETITGHIQSDLTARYIHTNLKIEGDIAANGVVNCHRLQISGNIYGKVDSVKDIEVTGSVGKNSKEIISEYPTELLCRGNVAVSKNIENAKIAASKKVIAPKSDVFHSEIHAVENITLKNVHSSSEHPSILQIGCIPNIKLNALNRSIDEHTIQLRELLHQDELDELTFKLKHKIKVQNEYLEKQNVLDYLLKLCDNPDLKHLENLENKVQMFEPSPTSESEPENNFTFLRNETSLNYIDEILTCIKGFSNEQEKTYLSKTLAEVCEMYKAAVDETERYTSEHRARSGYLMRKIEKMRPEIDQLKNKIDMLLVEKDFLQLRKKKVSPALDSAIRVKNMVEKNTIIKGRKAMTVLKDSIFGVRLKELKDPKTNEYQIVIDGYYD